MKDYLELEDDFKVVVIATYRFGVEIEEQLTKESLIKRKDFYFWDDAKLYMQDRVTLIYIDFLSEIWKNNNVCGSKSKIYPCMQINRSVAESMDRELGTWLYEEFMKEWTVEKHQRIVDGIEAILQKLDDRKLEVLYRKKNRQ